MLKSLFRLRDISFKSCQFHIFKKVKYASTFQRQLHISNIVIRNEHRNKIFEELVTNKRLYSSSAAGNKSNGKHRFYVILGGTFVALGACLFSLMYFKKRSNIPDIKKTSLQKSQNKKKRPFVELPKEIEYLIIGAGTAAHAACRAIRSADTNAKVLIVGEEDYYPYMRPPLSKELWHLNDDEALKKLNFKQWNGKERSLFYEKDAFYTPVKDLVNAEHGGVSVAMQIKAIKIDVVDQKVHFDNGQTISYKKCLLATGGTPKNLPIFSKADYKVQEKVTLFRTIEDFFYLDNLIKSGKKVVVIGGGFLGSELACSLGKRASLENKSQKVMQIFPEKGNMGLILPEYLSVWTSQQVRKEGVEVIPECKVVDCSFNKNENKVELILSNGEKIMADEIVVAVGLDPKTDLAKESGLEVDPNFGGFLVNAELEARTNIWAAGDAACFYDTKLGRRRVEHHDHAIVSGRLAGENMVSKTSRRPYWHQSMFWSDLGPNVGYDGIGLTDSKLETISVFAQASPSDTPKQSSGDNTFDRTISTEEKKDLTKSVLIEEIKGPIPEVISDDFGKGVIFYLRNDIVVGIILWNLFNRMPVARKVINEGRKFEDLNEVAKLFKLFGGIDEDDDDDEAPKDKKF